MFIFVVVPRIGFGTAALSGDKSQLLKWAFDAGYRLFDSASDTGPWYKSETHIGWLMRKEILAADGLEAKAALRKSLMVTSKLHPNDFNAARTKSSLHQTFTNVQKEYVDLYLLHYPSCGKKGETWLCKDRDGSEGTWRDVWPILESEHHRGSLGAIGVANFGLSELQELVRSAVVKPHVVQSWFDPYHQNWELVKYCREMGIVFQAYSSLGTQWTHRQETGKKNPILGDETLVEIAKAHSKSVPQIVLRWLLQEDILVIPRSNSQEHIVENMNVFDFTLSTPEIAQIRALNGKASRS
jgi:diketogulonate reductase-like aldo/keto reductase